MKKIFFLFFLLPSHLIFSQSLTARVVDANNNPIAFATVQISENTGVITNEEGYFTINSSEANNDELTFSCLGFTTITISIDKIKDNDYIIQLEEFISELNKVYLSNTTPNADEIIRKVNLNLSNNYRDEKVTYNFFHRNTAYADFNRFEVKINKASGMRKRQLEGVNKSIDSLTNSIINSNTVYFQDYLGDLMIDNKKKTKLEVHKATSLVDNKNNFSLDNVQEKAQHLILKYLDTTMTYKLKTGIIKIEDSLSLRSSEKKSEEKENTYDVSNLKGDTHRMVRSSQVYDNSFLRKIVDPERYKYEFIDVTSYNGELVYMIGFRPRKAKSKYAGTLYITDETFAVIKLDYDFGKGKRGEKFNLRLLLGIKYVENINSGTIIYQKSESAIYVPKYIKEEEGHYFYVNRPIKFIENSSRKNKVGFNFTIEGSAKAKNEVYIISNADLDLARFNAYKELKEIPYERLKRYDASIWKNYNAIEPLEEMKTFNAEN
ncbi:carboxypeptidase-like regulatory domain-containing protein [Flavobacteriaceae sp. LMIT009]